MATIDVERLESDDARTVVRVSVREGGNATAHRVTVKRVDLERLGGQGETAEAFVRRCFEFLLARESKESILATFDVSVIERYFPDFESRIRRS